MMKTLVAAGLLALFAASAQALPCLQGIYDQCGFTADLLSTLDGLVTIHGGDDGQVLPSYWPFF
jgi:hypothetical protein